MEEIKAYYALTKEAFSMLAPFYNVMTLPLVGVRERVVEFTRPNKGSTILDVATGTGQQAFAFANHGYDVTGVDITESMLEIARKNNRSNSVKFELADATFLRFDKSSFDVCCISLALHDMPLTIREKVLQEMVRVTRSNGMIVIVDYDLPPNKIHRALIYRLITLYESEYYKEFIVSDLRGLFKKTGLKITGELSVLFGAGRIFKGSKSSWVRIDR